MGAMNPNLPAVFACAALAAAVSAAAAPVVPGEFTDPTNLRREAESREGDWYVAPPHLRFPYVATYHVEPTVTTKDRVTIPFYVTDWDHSKVRFLDDSFRFTVRCKWIGPDGKAHETERRGVPSGDGAFDLGRLPAGEYEVCVWAVGTEPSWRMVEGLESHRVWQSFRVVEPKDLEIPADKVYAVTAKDLAAYGIRADGDLGRKVLVEVPEPPEGTKPGEAQSLAREAVEAFAAANPPAPREGAPGYTVFVPARGGKVLAGSWKLSKVVLDAGYDTNAVEQAAIATAEGLQKLLDDKAAAGFRKVVLAPGTYRVSAFRKIKLPDRFTLDLNGATLKENAFTGHGAVIVEIDGVDDAHLVNGTLEGDYYEHDYAHSEHNSEWPMGFHINGAAAYCSVEDVVVRDITGYGGGNGMGRVDGEVFRFRPVSFSDYAPGGLDPRYGTVDETETGRCTSGFLDLKKTKGAGRLQVSAYLGYQGIRGPSWQLTGCWYDAEKRFLASETIYQYRVVPIPEGAAYLRISVAIPDPAAARKAALVATLFFIPRNCAVRRCTFDRCRCVGYSASAMKNFLFEDNLFTHSGESAAKCAFDAEDGWDMMQDATFRGNRCEENPVNNRLLTCAGHNFVFERNRCGLYLWPRTYSPCIRDNEIDVGVFKCDRRTRSGYGRFERNVFTKALQVPSECRAYPGWEFVFPGETLSDGVEGGAKIEFGITARIAGGAFKGRTISVPNAVGCTFETCKVERLPAGRWLGVGMEGGEVSVLRNTNEFARCSFKGTKFSSFNAGEQTFRDCTFEDCSFHGTGGATLAFEGCSFTGGGMTMGWWAAPADIAFRDCTFDATGEQWFKGGAYGVGSFLFERCRFASSNGACRAFVDLFDWRASGGDATPGTVAFRDCTVGEGVGALVGCSMIKVNGYVKPGKDPTKKIDFVFSGNSLAPGAVEQAELPRRR